MSEDNVIFFFFSSRRRHTRLQGDWSSDVCSSDLSVVSVNACPATSSTGSLAIGPSRILGPGRSARMVRSRSVARAAARRLSIVRPWSSNDPCEKLSRATSIPARIMSSITARDADAGPTVAVIFVLCPRSGIAPAAPSGPALQLAGDRLGRLADRGWIAEVEASPRAQVVLERVHERDAGRDVEPDDGVVGDAVEILHEGPEAVAVGGDEDLVARADPRRDRLVPVRQEAFDRVLEALRRGRFLGSQARIAGIEARMTRIVRAQGGRPHVVAPAPEPGLLFAVSFRGLRLVQAL